MTYQGGRDDHFNAFYYLFDNKNDLFDAFSHLFNDKNNPKGLPNDLKGVKYDLLRW